MKNLKLAIMTGGAAALLAGCAATGANDQESAVATNAIVEAAVEEGNPGQWPPAGCKTPSELQAFIAANPTYANSYYLGVYSGGINPLDNGNIFWLGTQHGANVQPPETALPIAPTERGVGVLLRWNIYDTYMDPVSRQQAPESVARHYLWDYDQSLMNNADGVYAYDALAINLCTTDQNGTTCQQPLFGEKAWQDDANTAGFELCPPIILKSDTSSVYVWDRNDNDDIQTYEYSLAVKLNIGGANASKSGLRVVLDPKVRNGGVGTR